MSRYIVIGDIHGCADELKDLLKKCDYKMDYDTLISVGDLIDKGPKSVEVVELLCGWDAILVMGNHDEKAVRYHKHVLKHEADPKYKIPMRLSEEKQAIFPELIRVGMIPYLAKGLPFYELGDSWVVVHGGFMPDTPYHTQDPKQTCRLRYLHPDGSMASLDKDLKPPPNTRFWTEMWKGPKSVIYGHSARNLERPTVMHAMSREGSFSTIGLDTGCAYGGHLSALIFHERAKGFLGVPQLVQVKAKQQYAPYYEEQGD